MEKGSSQFAGFKKAGAEKTATVDLVHEKVKDASGQKIGRNDPCPCGKVDPNTGKPVKYKKCCYLKDS